MSSAEENKSPVHDGGRTSQPHYCEFPPGPILAALVECFWTSTVPTAPRTSSFHRVLPDGCMDLLFDFMTVGGRRASVIVRFRPGGLSAFLTLDAAELTDAQVDLKNFWGHLAEEAWHRLGEATAANRIWLLREMLGTRANGRNQTDPFIHHCVTRIEAVRGGLRISDLEKSTGLSTRQLERKFARYLGISPKIFARVVRFRGVAVAAGNPDPPDWVTLAGDFGFADQPHLAREFKAFSGLTPTDYLDATNNSP